MKKNKALIIAIIVSVGLLALVVILAVVFSSNHSTSKKEVATYKISAQPATLFSGTVQAEETDSYSDDSSLGKLSQINVRDGQQVKAGDTLLTYQSTNADLTSLTFAVQTAQNTLDNANQNLASTQSQIAQLQTQLSQTKDATEQATITSQITAANQTLLQNQQAVTTAQLGLSQAQTQLSQAQAGQTVTVQAKQDGIAQVNANAPQGSAIITVVSNNRIVMGSVTEFDYSKLKTGEIVSLATINGNQKTTGTITEISQTPNATTAAAASATGGSTVVTYSFTVSPDVSLQYGYTVQISLPNTDLIIPKSAVKNGTVKLKVGNQFETRQVGTAGSNGQIRVWSGLKVGDIIAKDWNTAS